MDRSSHGLQEEEEMKTAEQLIEERVIQEGGGRDHPGIAALTALAEAEDYCVKAKRVSGPQYRKHWGDAVIRIRDAVAIIEDYIHDF